MRHDQIALQLYTVRSLAAQDLPGTLRAVADAGYGAVELAGLPDTPPRELAAMLDAAGLRVVASHEGIERLRADGRAVADRLAAVGCPLVIVPWMPEEDRREADDVRRFAEELERYAVALGSHGMRLGYHNHDFEFTPMDGTTAWDVLVQELSPEVELELDVYWASVGGRDPVAEIRAHPDRIRLVHVKDRARALDTDREPRDAPVGDGVLPMAEIIDASRSAAVAWYVVEQDVPSDPLRDIRRSHEYLTRLAR
ncbi:MAG: sugar phosphate isomerase/epimerase [Chloroflexota bacterium]|nr:sugar phosphate isomerase/epimerase [Chloroflexota bacterium]